MDSNSIVLITKHGVKHIAPFALDDRISNKRCKEARGRKEQENDHRSSTETKKNHGDRRTASNLYAG